MIILNETRADVGPTMRKIWPGAKLQQILPVLSNGAPTRACTAVILKPGIISSLQERISLVSDDKNELIQAVKIKLDHKTCLVGMYVGPHTSGLKLERILTKMVGDNKHRVVITGDINARHSSWGKKTNTIGRALVRFALQRNYKISPPTMPSYTAKGITSASKPDLMLDLEKALVTQPVDHRWDNSSHHTPLVYQLNDINIKMGKTRKPKSMLNNSMNLEEAG